MQCNKCGSILAEGATFCPNCGAPVEQNMGNTTPNNLNSGVGVDANNQGANPDLMAQMVNQPSNSVQPETQNAMNSMQSDMTNQTVNNSQPDLMSQMPNTDQTSVQPEMPNAVDNMQPNMNSQNFNYDNNQQTNSFSNSQPTPPMNSSSKKKSIGKKIFIIGGVIVIIIAVILACLFLFNNSGNVVNIEGVNVWVPKDYTEESQSGYNKIYMSRDNDVMVGLISQTALVTLDQYMEALDSGEGLGSIECEKGTKQTIKGQEWARYSCSDSETESNMYITIKDNKLYMVEIAAKKASASKIDSIEKNVRQNLEFTN